MLDVPNTMALVDKVFLPLVTEDIWLGEMNHPKDIEKYSDNGIKKAIEIIKENQSVQNLIPIYEKFQNNSKVKWKKGTREKIEKWQDDLLKGKAKKKITIDAE